MKVLIACEESQEVCKAFRELGHEAYSCDILPCSGGHPEWHIKGDVLRVIKNTNWGYGEKKGINFETEEGTFHIITERWDLIIAHPPCTYLTNAAARHLYPNKILNKERYKKGLEAKEFFMKLFNADAQMVAVENPTPSKIFCLPECSQAIQPFQFGHPYSKRTQLWLKNLPKLKPTNVVNVTQSTKVAGNWFNKGGKNRQINRSKTFPGIAKAMATQWSEYLTKLNNGNDGIHPSPKEQ